MKTKFKKIQVLILATLLLLLGFAIDSNNVEAANDEADAIVLNEILKDDALILRPGQKKHMILPIRAINAYMHSAFVTIDVKEGAPFTVTNMLLSEKGDGVPAFGVSNYGTSYVEFDITVKETAQIGSYPVVITVSALNQNTGQKYPLDLELDFSIVKELTPAQISLSDVSVRNAKVGSDTNMIFRLRNEGEVSALSTYVSVNYGAGESSTGIIPLYETPKIKVGDLTEGKYDYISLPVRVLPTAEAGLKTVTLNIEYKDVDGKAYTVNHDIFVDVTKKDNAPSLIVEDISIKGILEPDNNLNLVATLKNSGDTTAKDISIKVDEASEGFGATGLIKNYFTESLWVGSIKAEEKKNAEIPLKVSNHATGGIKTLNIIISYKDEAGTDYETKATVYPDVIAPDEDEDQVSKPKLIVSKYSTDTEELRAGSTFNFIFDITNTHSTVAAKNITITVTQEESIFTPTQGSNSFFVQRIAPGDTTQHSLEMKVKADTMTKAYPIKLKVAYEYDGIKANPATGEIGETEEIELSLQAVENSRPVVDYVNVYSWDGNVLVGNPATLSFEFYNMGKSPLNNVIATVEGDFTKSDGNMYFIGNIAAGSPSYAEFEVIPNVEGMAKGIVKITFEDSNGDEIEYTKEFETMVSSEIPFDPGMMPGGVDDVYNPDVIEVKKEILPMWLFIVVLIAIFVIFVPVSRKVIISIYKNRLHNKETDF
ncbi:MAG TPA: hypothetical protein GXZ21_03595 [Clostridiales bacterium]|nr:hypothetical protein [Clostridiales bacterium]